MNKTELKDSDSGETGQQSPVHIQMAELNVSFYSNICIIPTTTMIAHALGFARKYKYI